ncbi:type IV pilus modification PilV family protein [Vibrio atypicus]|uniref:type IV pilus modification PilV family protein n=1 Tax=Vibrio atypicus TaxID=558271 RepID=UPI00135B50E3|nr:prepilin-type N-terminal cleavage/methylation domain-containing protein [Vibrio atypicus]
MICKQQGMSLIEVLIAFVMIGIAALGLVKLQSVSESKADYAALSIEALYKAEEKLEHFTQRGMSSAAGSYSYADISGDSCNGTTICSVKSTGFKTECRVTPFSGLSNAVSVVTVEVCWWDRFGDKQSVKLSSAISKYSELDSD